MFVTAL